LTPSLITPIFPDKKEVFITNMAESTAIVGLDNVKTFLEAVLDYIRTIDPKTGKPVTGNEDAKQRLNSCKSIIGMLPFETDIPYNISRIQQILGYLHPLLRDKTSLHNLFNRAKEQIELHHEESARKQTAYPRPQPGYDRGKRDYVLSTRQVLRGRYADFLDIFTDAKESVVNQLRNGVSPEILEERLNQMQKRIDREYTGGIDGLKIYFDAVHSDLLFAAGGGQVEEQREFLFRMAKTFIAGFLSNNFYDLHKRISHKAKEDLYSFVFRMAKKYSDIKANNPNIEIIPYSNGDGNIQLKAK
jgi:hypothetical protein